MIGRETLRIAWGGIVANKLRSGLTILGMTIGVASVIVLIAVGNGSSKAVSLTDPEPRHERADRADRRLSRRRAREHARRTVSLTEQDAEALQSKSLAPDVQSASPVVNATSVKLVSGSSSYEPSSFVGTTPSYLTAHSYKVAKAHRSRAPTSASTSASP